MIIPKCLKKGDKIAIVSLSRGLLGEEFIKHELDLALKRLEEFGLIPIIMPNAMKGIDYLASHPEARAQDLKTAFQDESIKAIIAAIGGNDAYMTIPYLMEDDEFKQAVINNPKIFVGFSDTTINHLMLNKLGLTTFYGPSLLVDLAELDTEMLPYTKKYFMEFFQTTQNLAITSSDVWYLDRPSYGPEALNTPRQSVTESHGYETINGHGIKTGELYGGCIESIYDAMTNENESPIFTKYQILPTESEWQNKILFLETSDERITPAKLEEILTYFQNKGIFSQVQGLIVGKPIDEKYYDEYKAVYQNVFKNSDTPILYNVNFGHSVPHCILPYGIPAKVDYDQKTITIQGQFLEK